MRYPWEPLGRLVSVKKHAGGELVGKAEAAAARFLDVDPQQVRRWKALGLLREHAERMAERAGFVPYEVWPEILNDLDDMPSRVCASEGCDEEFDVGWPYMKRRYCSENCRRREERRRKKGAPVTMVCPSTGCGLEFTPKQVTQRWCSRTCRYREIGRRRAATRTEQQREAVRAYQAEYRAASVRARNAYRRRYYEANREREIARAVAAKRARVAERRAA